jgi:predicted acyltransferase
MSTAIDHRPPSGLPANRLVSLDVLRGITIAFMILVNNGIQNYAYPALEHAEWNGWTPTDLVFPTFLFLVGVSIVFPFESRLGRGASKSALLVHTFRRACILFALGLVVNGFPHFPLATLRIYGVLQRIAICFLIASILYLLDRRATSKIAMVLVALFGYWVLLRWVSVPGFGIPGRNIPLFDPTHNLGAYIDRHIFPGRLYRGVRDPQGLLSTIPALGTTLLGMLTGMWMRSKRNAALKAWGMLAAGVLGILLGVLWGHWFPINKNLWSSSYVLFAAGCALMALSICYWAIDIKNWENGRTYYLACFWNERNHGIRVRRAPIVHPERNQHTHENKNSKPKLISVRPLFCSDPLTPLGVAGLFHRYHRGVFYSSRHPLSQKDIS